MTPILTKTCLIAGAALMLAQPVLAQETSQQVTQQDLPPAAPAPEMRPYSQAELQQAYERGRADQARETQANAGLPPQGPEPVGYCYQRQQHARTTGTIVGAILGGVIGNGLSNRWDRGGNTIGGAMLGGMLGSAVGQDSVECYQNAYYAYDDGYYAPPRPPRGYMTVFFTSTPSYGYRHYHGRPHFGYGYGYGRRW